MRFSILGVAFVALGAAASPRDATCPGNSTAIQVSTGTSSSPALYTAPLGNLSKPKILLIANEFEFGYLSGINFTTAYTDPLLESLYACTEDGVICRSECGQELVSTQQITALLLILGMDFRRTYFFITGTGGVEQVP